MSTICGWKHLGEGVEIHEPKVVLNPERISIGDWTRIDSFCKLEAGIELIIGERVHIASFCHINAGGGHTLIGAHAGIATGAKILSGQPDLTCLPITPCEPPEDVHPLRYTTVIGEYAFICAGAIVQPGITIGKGAVLAPGAVATKDIPDFEVWSGIPARKVRDRELVIR